MPIRSLSALSPEPRRIAETYLRDVAEALQGADAESRDDIMADLESHLLESLDSSATADDVSRIIAELGSPESFSAELGGETEPRTRGAGRLLGMPYDCARPHRRARRGAPLEPKRPAHPGCRASGASAGTSTLER